MINNKKSVIKESIAIEYQMLLHKLEYFEETEENYEKELANYITFTKVKFGQPPIKYYSKAFIEEIYRDFVVNKRQKKETIDRLNKEYLDNNYKK